MNDWNIREWLTICIIPVIIIGITVINPFIGYIDWLMIVQLVLLAIQIILAVIGYKE